MARMYPEPLKGGILRPGRQGKGYVHIANRDPSLPRRRVEDLPAEPVEPLPGEPGGHAHVREIGLLVWLANLRRLATTVPPIPANYSAGKASRNPQTL